MTFKFSWPVSLLDKIVGLLSHDLCLKMPITMVYVSTSIVEVIFIGKSLLSQLLFYQCVVDIVWNSCRWNNSQYRRGLSLRLIPAVWVETSSTLRCRPCLDSSAVSFTLKTVLINFISFVLNTLLFCFYIDKT